MNKITIFRMILSVILLLGLALSSCNVNTGNSSTVSDNNSGGELEPVEVREYQGEKLSSVNDFREN